MGTGFAVWINYHRLQGMGGSVYLSTGAAQTVVTTLAHASFAGWLGYVAIDAWMKRVIAGVVGVRDGMEQAARECDQIVAEAMR